MTSWGWALVLEYLVKRKDISKKNSTCININKQFSTLVLELQSYIFECGNISQGGGIVRYIEVRSSVVCKAHAFMINNRVQLALNVINDEIVGLGS